jgi:hypothetical protein
MAEAIRAALAYFVCFALLRFLKYRRTRPQNRQRAGKLRLPAASLAQIEIFTHRFSKWPPTRLESKWSFHDHLLVIS